MRSGWKPGPLVLVLLAPFVLPAPRDASSAPKKPLSSHDRRAKALLGRMTLDEKVGQMTQADLASLDLDKDKAESDVETLFLGSVLSGGDSDPPTNGLDDWRDTYERLQVRALRTRLRIPLLYGVDAVHGHNNVVGAVVFPHNVGLGATRDPVLVEEIGRITALEMRATGIHWTFAPCVTVPRDVRWGRTYEGFSEDPELVARLGAAAVRGLQGPELADPRRVLACAKHFVGDGGTVWGTGMTQGPFRRPGLDRGDTRLTEAELRRLHLPGYLAAIEAGVGSIMVSFNAWNGQRCSASHRLLTEVLKGELRFEGFLVSDWNAIHDLPGDYREQVRTAVNAGIDMFMEAGKHAQFATTLKALVQEGAVPVGRIDDAVTRILRVKLAMGLMDGGGPPKADRSLDASFGSHAHRQAARRAVRQSLVLLKNEGGVLPLSRTAKRIHVAGASADDLGTQCGGWTITWQGRRGPVSAGTTILGAILQRAPATTKVTYSRDGSGAAGADVAVVVVGEAPHAEFQGDREDLSLGKEDLDAIAAVDAAGVPVVVVLLSGRPMILGEALEKADAFVAAWLPGTEGQGVADVLFGDHRPTGKLPFTWPRSMDQIPIDAGDLRYEPLFPYGFGLTY